jgi:hypothetical protein
MFTPAYKKLKKNGTTLYVFPSVAEDKNFESQNTNYNMRLSHFVLVNFPRQNGDTFDFENTFVQNSTSVQPSNFADALVESLRNYVANHEATIRNSKINNTDSFYDPFELSTTTEKIFWKWCKKLKLIDFEVADINNEFNGADPKYNDNGPVSNTTHFREYLWKERSNTIYNVTAASISTPATTIPAVLPPLTPGKQFGTITLTASTNLKPGDYVFVNEPGIDAVGGFGYSQAQSLLKVVGLATTTTINDTIVVEIDATLTAFPGTITDYEIYNAYERFVQFVSEIGGMNNVQLPDKAYTETFAYISHQHGQMPYSLWNIKTDNNYKPNSQYPILPSEYQGEIQGGENVNNPILVDPTNHPGDIWAHYDDVLKYKTSTGNINQRNGDYYGVTINNNLSPTLKYPEFDSTNLDGLTLNLNINDYAKATSYIYPIETFGEFCGTAFNNEPPKDFEFNAILWYYTLEDVSGNNLETATNLYGVEFLDTPNNDVLTAKSQIPKIKKLVSNGYQDGTSYTFSLDTNIVVDSDAPVPTFDPDKVYSLFGLDLFNEAMMRITYFNDKLTEFLTSNIDINNKLNNLTSIIYTQQDITSIRNKMDHLENLLTLYSTLQIGDSDTIVSYLDTSVNPPLVRLKSIDKKYGSVYQYYTSDMYNESINTNSLTQVTNIPKTIPVVSGKDFLVIVNNDDISEPTPSYDTTVMQDKLELILDKDLQYKQSIDIEIVPKLAGSFSTQPYPLHDKKLQFFINYDDGNNISKLFIKEFSLPVLKNKNGANYISEAGNDLKYIPKWNVLSMFYSKENNNIRKISFIVDADLINMSPGTTTSFLDAGKRMLVENLLIESDAVTPTNKYTDLSSQYELFSDGFNPVYKPGHIIDVEIINSGAGYTNGVYVETITTVVGGTNVNTNIEFTVVGGSIINAEIISSNLLRTPDNVVIYPVTINGSTGTTQANIKFIPKAITKITIAFNPVVNTDITAMFASYDTVFNVNSMPLNVMFNMTKYCKLLPTITLLKSYKIKITRISEDINIQSADINKRYDIKITTN